MHRPSNSLPSTTIAEVSWLTDLNPACRSPWPKKVANIAVCQDCSLANLIAQKSLTLGYNTWIHANLGIWAFDLAVVQTWLGMHFMAWRSCVILLQHLQLESWLIRVLWGDHELFATTSAWWCFGFVWEWSATPCAHASPISSPQKGCTSRRIYVEQVSWFLEYFFKVGPPRTIVELGLCRHHSHPTASLSLEATRGLRALPPLQLLRQVPWSSTIFRTSKPFCRRLAATSSTSVSWMRWLKLTSTLLGISLTMRKDNVNQTSHMRTATLQRFFLIVQLFTDMTPSPTALN